MPFKIPTQYFFFISNISPEYFHKAKFLWKKLTPFLELIHNWLRQYSYLLCCDYWTQIFLILICGIIKLNFFVMDYLRILNCFTNLFEFGLSDLFFKSWSCLFLCSHHIPAELIGSLLQPDFNFCRLLPSLNSKLLLNWLWLEYLNQRFDWFGLFDVDHLHAVHSFQEFISSELVEGLLVAKSTQISCEVFKVDHFS